MPLMIEWEPVNALQIASVACASPGRDLAVNPVRAGSLKSRKFRMAREMKERPARANVAAVQLSAVSDVELHASVSQLREFAKTLGFEVVVTFLKKRDHTTAYLGVGKTAVKVPLALLKVIEWE